jgi:hypothetical protein
LFCCFGAKACLKVFEKYQSFEVSFRVVGIITGGGTVLLIRAPSNTKINSQYYVDYVLKPLFNKLLPRFYPNEMNKIFFHYERHTSRTTTSFVEKQRRKKFINYIESKDIPVKSPDASPLDFLALII